MRTSIRVLPAALTAGAALVGALAVAAPAHAGGAWNTWGAGSYHAGYDGVASGSNFTLKGSGCGGGNARYFYVQLVQTSNGNKIKSTFSWPTDGNLYRQGGSGTRGGVAYYTRWYGQDSHLNNGYSAPCAGAGFDA